MRLIARLLLGAVLWALLEVSPAQVVVLSAQELWYQAYRAGVAAYQRGDWGEPVFTVGHAIEDWGASESNVVLSPIDDQESRWFVISAAGIA